MNHQSTHSPPGLYRPSYVHFSYVAPPYIIVVIIPIIRRYNQTVEQAPLIFFLIVSTNELEGHSSPISTLAEQVEEKVSLAARTVQSKLDQKQKHSASKATVRFFMHPHISQY